MPDLPKMFPDWLDRIQIKYMNPVIRPFAGRIPGLATLTHRGRRSGKSYHTVVTAYRRGGEVAIVLGHGETDWLKNVLAAGEAHLRMQRDDFRIADPRVVPAGTAVAALPAVARLQARRAAVFVATVASD